MVKGIWKIWDVKSLFDGFYFNDYFWQNFQIASKLILKSQQPSVNSDFDL